MKVLVIGATGLLGKPIVKELEIKGHSLRLFSRSINDSELSDKYDCYQGDVLDACDVSKAIKGCDAVHISIANTDEALAVEVVVNEAKKQRVNLISYVSGCSVSEENRWFWYTDNKFRAEQVIKDSGISYLIFKPTWLYESLGLFVNNGRASVIGKIPECHWVSAIDFGKLVANAFEYKQQNKTVFVYGPEKRNTKELLEKYCKKLYPNIKKVGYTPTFILKMIGKLSGKSEIKFAAELFSYGEKVTEPIVKDFGIEVTDIPTTRFENWLENKTAN